MGQLYAGDAVIRIRNAKGVAGVSIQPGERALSIRLDTGHVLYMRANESGLYEERDIKLFLQLLIAL